ncbi:Hypothetical protein NTJ_07567 [Nesidiocoris tenuis]|uniref:Uncharacterized protein n=1 Tax=Nesidiocoris tenuis TaxID=355587 RepID=A0ABN7ARS0_9HEMI|nr:Hypothetical protein NTJ_07567 [Nesidiocoris tenuis]
MNSVQNENNKSNNPMNIRIQPLGTEESRMAIPDEVEAEGMAESKEWQSRWGGRVEGKVRVSETSCLRETVTRPNSHLFYIRLNS